MAADANNHRERTWFNFALPWLVLAVGVMLAFVASWQLRQKLEQSERARFERLSERVTSAIQTRIQTVAQTLRGAKRHPTLMDEVTVYSGASILGGETIIGEGAVIASNVFLTQSVPPRTRVSGKNPELQYKDRKPVEFKQELPDDDWVI